MSGHSKFFYIIISFIILLVIGCVLFLYPGILVNNLHTTPYKLINPSSYATGTTISLYKDPAPDFPKEFIVKGVSPQYSGVVKSPSGTSKITVTYSYQNSIQDLYNFYLDSVTDTQWSVISKIYSDKIAIIQLKDGIKKMVITIAPRETDNIITLQYEY